MAEEDDEWWEDTSPLGSRSLHHAVPIGVDEDGTPVYDMPPALLASLERTAGKCVMGAQGGCGGDVTHRSKGRVAVLLCDVHAEELSERDDGAPAT